MLSSLSRSIGSVLVRRGLGEKLRDRCEVVECCGIVGYAGPQDASTILTTGVELLQNRGYDSCGIATCFKKKLITTKFASKGTTSDCVDSLKHASAARHGGHNIGIAHTRWATHGGKTDQNAHPHSDFKNRIALVHNGTIDNFLELKQELKAHGIQFKSETDTEVIANLIGYYLDKNYTLENAVRKAVSRLTGTWGIAVIHKDDANGIVCARNGSPLIIGSAPGQIFVASEPLAMAEHTNEFVALNDGDVVYVNSSTGITDIVDGRDKRTIEIEDVKHNPSPHAHWTEREIYEQPEALSRALNYGARLGKGGSRIKLGGLEQNEAQLKKLKRMVITGCGTSLNAGLYGELLMRSLGCFDSVYTVDSSEVDSRTFGKSGDDTALLALTQSGETRDVVTALQEATKMNMRLVSVVNQVGSLVARMSGCGVYLNAGREVAVASTKAFTSQVAVLALIACWFAQLKETGNTTVDHLVLALHKLPMVASKLLTLDKQCKELATKLMDTPSLFVLGKGFAHSVALEGALKIKEISYIHAEGFGGGQLKHGPFALIDENIKTPVIMIVLNDEHYAAMVNAAQQVKARGARLIVITDEATPNLTTLADDTVVIPSNGPLTALGAVVPLQLLAYYLAVQRGINPDKPRGLAKTVTVM